MKTYSAQVRVEAEHIDKGDHANWRAQLAIAEIVHFSFRKELGLGLEELKEKHGLFLMMRNVFDVRYREQLRLGDIIDVEITMWIAKRTSLEFHCLFKKDGKTATEMRWLMPLISIVDQNLCRIPPWMIDAIGIEKPEALLRPKPASTSN